MSVFISAQELHDDIRNAHNLTVISTVWAPLEGQSEKLYQSNHIPTSLFCDPAESLAGIPSSQEGRNPMPSVHTLENAFRKWGLKDSRPVVVLDPGPGVFAARAWWTLRWAGIRDVRILDGGHKAWDALGLPTVGGPGNITVDSDFEITPGSLPTKTIDEVKSFEGQLIDARGEKRYAGRREVLDLKAGHIPGAVNLPVGELFDENHKIKSVDFIRDRFAQVGITQNTDPESAVTYSGSGNHSALLLAAMEHAGLPIISHYVGGWSQWSANPANSVARTV